MSLFTIVEGKVANQSEIEHPTLTDAREHCVLLHNVNKALRIHRVLLGFVPAAAQNLCILLHIEHSNVSKYCVLQHILRAESTKHCVFQYKVDASASPNLSCLHHVVQFSCVLLYKVNMLLTTYCIFTVKSCTAQEKVINNVK